MQEGPMEPIRIATDVSVQMAFACENFSTDPMQRVTFHNIIEVMNAPQFPIQTSLLYVVFGFQRNVPGFLVQCKVEIVPADRRIRSRPRSSRTCGVSPGPDGPARHRRATRGTVWPWAPVSTPSASPRGGSPSPRSSCRLSRSGPQTPSRPLDLPAKN